MILWYQQLKGDSALNLIGYVNYKDPTTENQYKNQFTIGGNGAESSTLNVTLEREHVGSTAVYYCAASKAQCGRSFNHSYKNLRLNPVTTTLLAPECTHTPPNMITQCTHIKLLYD